MIPTAVLTNTGSISFLHTSNNYDVFSKLGAGWQITQRAADIEVYAELESDEQHFLDTKFERGLSSPDPENAIEFEPFDFWVRLDFHDFLGPFKSREAAERAEREELKRRHVI
jgi:hypothetical protein